MNIFNAATNMVAGMNIYDLFGICFNFSNSSSSASFHKNNVQSNG